MKIQELFETRKYDSEPVKYDVQLHGIKSDPKDGIALMKKYASDAMWMLKKNRPIYRGTTKRIINDVSIADPSKSERISSNTSNHYTIIFDNHPEMKDFPKRSKSFIASTNSGRSLEYAGVDIDRLYVLIPFNNVKIGIVPAEDIWDLTITFLGYKGYDIEEMNRVFDEFGIKSNSIDDFKAFAKDLKDDKREFKMFKDETLRQVRKDFMKVIWDAYSPKRTGLTYETTATMDRTLPNNEVWIGGKCLCVRFWFWHNMIEEYNKK